MHLRPRPLALLVTVLVASLLGGGCGAGGTATEPSPAKDEQEAAESTPDAPETPATADDEASDEPALRITTKQVDSLGTPATAVVEIGALSLDGPANLAAATEAFGEPDSQGASARDANVCEATWDELGLTLQFYFGHPPSLERSCREGIVAGAFMVEEERWLIVPGGLHVGDAADRISEAFPDAKAVTLPPGLREQLDTEAGYVVEEGAYGGDLSPILYAGIEGGSVVGLAYVSLAD